MGGSCFGLVFFFFGEQIQRSPCEFSDNSLVQYPKNPLRIEGKMGVEPKNPLRSKMMVQI